MQTKHVTISYPAMTYKTKSNLVAAVTLFVVFLAGMGIASMFSFKGTTPVQPPVQSFGADKDSLYNEARGYMSMQWPASYSQDVATRSASVKLNKNVTYTYTPEEQELCTDSNNEYVWLAEQLTAKHIHYSVLKEEGTWYLYYEPTKELPYCIPEP